MAGPDTSAPLACLNGVSYRLRGSVQEPQQCGCLQDLKHSFSSRSNETSNNTSRVIVAIQASSDNFSGSSRRACIPVVTMPYYVDRLDRLSDSITGGDSM